MVEQVLHVPDQDSYLEELVQMSRNLLEASPQEPPALYIEELKPIKYRWKLGAIILGKRLYEKEFRLKPVPTYEGLDLALDVIEAREIMRTGLVRVVEARRRGHVTRLWGYQPAKVNDGQTVAVEGSSEQLYKISVRQSDMEERLWQDKETITFSATTGVIEDELGDTSLYHPILRLALEDVEPDPYLRAITYLRQAQIE